MKLKPEIESRMQITAENSLSHIKYLKAKREAGEELNNEDLGMLALENMFLVLYALHVKKEIPDFAMKYFDNETH